MSLADRDLPASEAGAGWRVLITNTALRNYSGSELYVRDVALALRRRSHQPLLYSPRLGALADELRQAGLTVTDDLRALSQPPHLIHGQHHLECMTAVAHFPPVPAVYFCHGVAHWVATPPRHPRVLHYVAVSDFVREHVLETAQLPPEDVSVISNFVDLERFQPRSPLPPRPQRALVFSNQAREDNFGGILRAACAQLGIALDIVGFANGNSHPNPEQLLGRYDLIFARGRSALEGLAVGAAVMACDTEGLGPLVTSSNLAELRRRNLGLSVLTRPITVPGVTEQIVHYDAADAQQVSQRVRAEAGLEAAVDRILDTYQRVLEAWRRGGAPDPRADAAALAAYLRWVSRTVSAPPALPRSAADARLRALEVEHAALQDELQGIQHTRTWRLYRRLVSLRPLRRAYQALLGRGGG